MLVAITAQGGRVLARDAVGRDTGPYRCPQCRADVSLVRSTATPPHFAHRALAVCPAAGQSDAHLTVKAGVFALVEAAPWVGRLDLETPYKGRTVDMLVVSKSGRRLVVECQTSALTASHVTERLRAYTAEGVAVWYVMPRAALGGGAQSGDITGVDGTVARFPDWSRPVWRATFDDGAGVSLGHIYEGGALWAFARVPFTPEWADSAPERPETAHDRAVAVDAEARVRLVRVSGHLEVEPDVALTADGSGAVARLHGTADALLDLGLWNPEYGTPGANSPLVQCLLGVAAPLHPIPAHALRGLRERTDRHMTKQGLGDSGVRAALMRADWESRDGTGEPGSWAAVVRRVHHATGVRAMLCRAAEREIREAGAPGAVHLHMRAGGLEPWQQAGVKATLDGARGSTPVCVPLASGAWARRPGGVVLSADLLVKLRAHYGLSTDVVLAAGEHPTASLGAPSPGA